MGEFVKQCVSMKVQTIIITLAFFSSVTARSRVLLEATTDVDGEDLMEVTTPYMEVEFMEDIEDVGLDNTEVNCHKCAKASFKFRKELFCEKCLNKGLYTADKAPQDYCKKCRKPKYFQKHLAYCEVKCTEYSPDEDETIELTTSLTTPEIPSSTTSAPDLGPFGNLLKLLVQANTWRH